MRLYLPHTIYRLLPVFAFVEFLRKCHVSFSFLHHLLDNRFIILVRFFFICFIMSEDEEPEEIFIDDFHVRKHFFNEETGVFSNPLTVIVGRGRSGKSTKLISLLSECRKYFGSVYLFSPTALRQDGSNAFGSLIPPAFCFNEPNEEALRRIQRVQRWLSATKPSCISQTERNCLIILDDFGEHPFMKSKLMRELASSGRHDNIALWVTYHQFEQIPSMVLENTDILFTSLARSQSIPRKTLKRMYEDVFSCFQSLACFDECLRHCSRQFGCLVWRNTAAFDDIQHSVFRYCCSHTNANAFSLEMPSQELILRMFAEEEQKVHDTTKNHRIRMNEAEFEEAKQLDPGENEDAVMAEETPGEQPSHRENPDAVSCVSKRQIKTRIVKTKPHLGAPLQQQQHLVET